jgi:diguanylate cyclase (GGDEF)-like protein
MYPNDITESFGQLLVSAHLLGYEMVVVVITLALLGGAWHLKHERSLRFWLASFAVRALTQVIRQVATGLGLTHKVLLVSHVGALVAALLMLLGLRAYLEQPLRPRWPVVIALGCALLASGFITLNDSTTQSLVVTRFGEAALGAIGATIAFKAWRSRRGFPLALFASELALEALIEAVRGISVTPMIAGGMEASRLNNAMWLVIVTGLMVAQSLAILLLLHDRALQQVRRLVEVDMLTTLLNRRGFDDRLRRLLSRTGGPATALALLDVDHFKRINDSYGHHVGDEVLRGIGERLRQALRPLDLAFRVGGEEFAVVWPAMEPGGERALGERLRQAVAAEPIPTTAGLVPVTVSVGVARSRRTGESLESLYRRTDASLYAAKGAGRNQTAIAPDSTFNDER